jgi:RNA polymerase sigma factor (sigma-70 family)
MYSIIEKHYKHNYTMFVKRASYRLNSKEDAEDAVQEAYCRALKYATAFEMGMHFNHWFSRILSNVMKDMIAEKYNRGSHEELDEEKIEGEDDSSYTNKLLDIIYEQIDKVENEEYKQVLQFYFEFGFSLQEINELSPLNYHNIHKIVKTFKKGLTERNS